MSLRMLLLKPPLLRRHRPSCRGLQSLAGFHDHKRTAARREKSCVAQAAAHQRRRSAAGRGGIEPAWSRTGASRRPGRRLRSRLRAIDKWTNAKDNRRPELPFLEAQEWEAAGAAQVSATSAVPFPPARNTLRRSVVAPSCTRRGEMSCCPSHWVRSVEAAGLPIAEIARRPTGPREMRQYSRR
jgi:hypothetical protein